MRFRTIHVLLAACALLFLLSLLLYSSKTSPSPAPLKELSPIPVFYSPHSRVNALSSTPTPTSTTYYHRPQSSAVNPLYSPEPPVRKIPKPPKVTPSIQSHQNDSESRAVSRPSADRKRYTCGSPWIDRFHFNDDKPDFFVIGVAKGGTTSFSNYIGTNHKMLAHTL